VFIFELGAMGAWAAFTTELTILSVILLYRLRGKAWLRGAALKPTG
jgi:Na+-driven multidrug efflux pump